MKPLSISFVMPMYNEGRLIGDTVKSLTRMAKELTNDYEIVIANDASSDDSGMIADRIAAKDPHVKVEHLKKNTKFGGALRAGIKRARKDIIVYTDSDLPAQFQDIKGAISVLDGCDIVTAYSTVKKGENLKRIVMSTVYNFVIQLFFRTNIKDVNSGLKVYKRKIFKDEKYLSNSPFLDVEIFVRAMRKAFVVKQYPIVFKHREKGKSYISRPAVVLQTLMDMLKFRFSA